MAENDHSEYDGGGPMPNTVYPKGPEALTVADKLRLGYITGNEEDPNSPPDPWHFTGGTYDPQVIADIEEAKRQRLARSAQIRREDAARYRESPY